jgi:predicted amidophosphoribosyltransferase
MSVTETSAIFRRSEVQKLLQAIKDGRIEAIEPILDHSGVRYPTIEDVTCIFGADLKSILEELSRLGILTSDVRNNLAVCPRCGSHRVMIHLRCPTCGSPQLKRGSMIEHLACGHIDQEENFRKGEQLFCPKCGKVLRAIGVDYRRPGILYKCLNCGGISSNPKVQYECDCRNVFSENEAALQLVSAYKPNPAKRELIEQMTIDFKSILEAVTSTGWHGQAPITIQSQSGIEHEFTFALWAPESDPAKAPPDVVAEMYTSEEGEVNSTGVLAFYAKTLDIKPNEKILIVMPSLDRRAKILANSYNMLVVEAETADSVMAKTRDLLLDIHRKREKENLERIVCEVLSKAN